MTNPITIKNTTFAFGSTKIAVPITASTSESIINQFEKLQKINPSVIEWRIDYFDAVLNPDCYEATYKQIQSLLGDSILLTTFRTQNEGGAMQLADANYFKLLHWIIENHLTDIIDIEAFRSKSAVTALVTLAHREHIYVILSNHDFLKTPSQQEIVLRFNTMAKMAGDFVKIAVMPQSDNDVVTLLNATLESAKSLTTPIISMAMGARGKFSRIAGPIFGSVLSFATVGNASAPGQLPYADLKQILAELTN